MAGAIALFRASAGFSVSALVHAVLLVVLGLVYLEQPSDSGDRLLTASVDDEQLDELEELALDELVLEEQVDNPTDVAFALEDPGVADLGSPPELEAMTGLRASDSSRMFEDLGSLLGQEGGRGQGRFGDGLGAEFYGVRTRGTRFVFVVDNSLSMRDGRFESACAELLRSVENMEPDQSFYVFFFSDTAYPLFHPRPVQEMVRATTDNKQKLAYWLPTVQLVLHTNAHKAVERALAMKPDAIYMLTDGAFTDDTAQFLLRMQKGRTTIHTVGMEIAAKGEQTLKAIAEHFNGSYRHVQTDPRIRMLAAQNPRKRNSTWAPIWGVELARQRPGANRRN